MNIKDILKSAGLKTVVGYDNIKRSIQLESDGNNQPLCSGYRVFPDGGKCPGCKDCQNQAR